MNGKHLASSKSHVVKGEEEKAADPLRRKVMPGDIVWVRLRGLSWWPAQVVNKDAVSRSKRPGNRSDDEVPVRVYGSYNYLYVDPVKCRSEFERALKQNNGSYREILCKSLEQDLPSAKSRRSRGRGSKSRGKDPNPKVNITSNNGNTAESTEGKGSKTFEDSSSQCHEEASEGKTLKRDRSQKKLKLSSPSTEKEAKRKTPQQDDMLKKKLNSNSPCSTTPSARKTCEKTSSRNSGILNERRMRVMRNLGLTAPPGSPFDKNGHT